MALAALAPPASHSWPVPQGEKSATSGLGVLAGGLLSVTSLAQRLAPGQHTVDAGRCSHSKIVLTMKRMNEHEEILSKLSKVWHLTREERSYFQILNEVWAHRDEEAVERAHGQQ